jgi:hypothetical protein
VAVATARLGWSLYNVVNTAVIAMTSEQAAQLIDDTLDLVHRRLQDLQTQALGPERQALAAEFREWRQPAGGHIDLMVFPGLANP